MKLYLHTVIAMAMLFLTMADPMETKAQCQSNMGFDNGNFGSWNTSTDSLFVNAPGGNVYNNPGINTKIVGYGSTDAWLGTITRPHPSCGNYLTKLGNRGVRAVADTVYRTYIIDSLSDKLTIYSRGVSEIAHNYWGLATIEAPGFGYEVYINGVRIDCLKGAFFCGNQDTPYVWNVGNFRDTSTVRKSVGWGMEELNFACFVGDTIQIRLFTRDCILLGHYAYAYFDILCGDTTKPAITKIMVNDIIAGDTLDLYCTDSAMLRLNPNTAVCPIFRGNINWSPSNFVFGASNVDSAILHNLDSVWIYAEATFSNFCTTLDVRDSIRIALHDSDPHDYIPKLPRNFCDCGKDTLDFGTHTPTSIRDQQGNTMTLTNGALIIQPCDKFYEECYWKQPSSKIVTNQSQIGTVGWVAGNVEGAIGVDSILATGTVRYIINQSATKRFFAGITTTNTNNSNDIDHAIYFNGGAISAYYKGSLRASLGSYTGNITVDFRTLANRRVEIWINGVRRHTFTSTQLAVFPVFPDFAAQSNDTNLISKTYVYGPTKNIKDFTRLLISSPYKYYLTYTDMCGIVQYDTFQIIPGFESNITPVATTVCGLQEISILITANGASIVDDIIPSSDGDGEVNVDMPNAIYTPVFSDFGLSPIAVYITAQSGRCISTDTAFLTFYENPLADAGPDISSPSPPTYSIGGSPAGSCTYCDTFLYKWTPSVALDDSTLANPTVTTSLVNNNFFALMVIDTATTCFSLDTAFILAPLSVNDVLLDTRCIGDDKLEFKWVLVPSIETYSFGIEYSVDDGSNWFSMGRLMADQNIVNNEQIEYSLTVDKIKEQGVQYRWYTFNMDNTQKSIIPIYDIDCESKTNYLVYPNPFSNNLNLEIRSITPGKKTMTIVFFNEYGQKVYEKTIGTETELYRNHYYLDGTESLSNGIYFMNIISNDQILFKTKINKLN